MAALAEDIVINPEGTLEVNIDENLIQAKSIMLEEANNNLNQNTKNSSSNILIKIKSLSIEDLTYSSHGNYGHSQGYTD